MDNNVNNLENCLGNMQVTISSILRNCSVVIYNSRIQNYRAAMDRMRLLLDSISTLVELFSKADSLFDEPVFDEHLKQIIPMLNDVMNVQKEKDYILLADLLELNFIPFLQNIQSMLVSDKEVVIDNELYEKNLEIIKKKDLGLFKLLKTNKIDPKYKIEYTSSGDITVAIIDKNGKYYFHSNANPWEEAALLVNEWYDLDKEDYIIYGLGLGYVVTLMALKSEYINIEVYESNLDMINLACMYMDISQLFINNNVTIIYDNRFSKLSDKIKSDKEIVYNLHYPSIRSIENDTIKEQLEGQFIQLSSIQNQIHLLKGNFKSNIKNFNFLVEKLKDIFYDKDIIIIAGGPSLDKNIDELYKVKDAIIVATGTVFRKLLNKNIRPNYVIVTDAQKFVYSQLEQLESENIPMIAISTVYKDCMKNYTGDKYIVLQKDFFEAEDFAKENNYMLFETGGSVTTTAIDIAIRFKCRRIICLGLDLAFTQNRQHASDTYTDRTLSSDDMIYVDGINGDKIGTSKNLNLYRNWIENRIKEEKEIIFIDATEGGASIKGMEIKKFIDCFDYGV